MTNNIITHIKSEKIRKLLKAITTEMNITELSIKSYEEFFHALTHINPSLFIVEISDCDDLYIRVIKIAKKSILTRDIPILVVITEPNDSLIELLSKEDIQAIIYPPVFGSTMQLYIKNFIAMMKRGDDIQNILDLRTVQSVLISGLASLAEYRDPETGEHLKRTQNYVKALSVALQRKGIYKEELTTKNIESMYISVPLHDIGKVGISDSILLKPERLTDEEFEIMKEHAKIGYQTIREVGSKLKNNSFLEYASDVAYTHHEKYDGTGYPRGLKGEEIPLVGRLMAVADVYDALTSKRVYKDAMSHEQAVTIIKDGIGTHFDPIIVDCMLDLESTFINIANTYRDNESNENKHYRLENLIRSNQLDKVLVVEDSRIVREITMNQLTSMGLQVDVAEDGLEGYDKASTSEYDLILLDIEMPKMNGYSMALKLRELSINSILIAMTAADYNVGIEELRKFNIAGLVLKPVDYNKVAAIYEEAKRQKC